MSANEANSVPSALGARLNSSEPYPAMPDDGTLPGSAFARQERVLIGLNLFSLAALAAAHMAFSEITDSSAFALVLLLFAVRFTEQAAELRWLRRNGDCLSERTAWWWARISILANIGFAGVVSISANSVDAHYTVLLLLPVVAAAFRLRFHNLLLTIGAAAGLSFLEIWVYFLRHPPADIEEFFEVTTEGLVFVVIGLVSWGLVNTMRRDAAVLKQALIELRETQDRLVSEEKLAAIGRLSSAIAHEIRNPVGVIVSALDMARRPELAEADREELRVMAATEAARLEKVTSDFLAYARTRPPERQPVSVKDALNYVAGLMRARIGGGGPQIDVVCAQDMTVQADTYQIQQALINLALNAVEHTAVEGRVALGACAVGASAQLYVENSGAAVLKDAPIFEPFYTTRPKGTGLGLPISRNIARAHGGDVVLTKNTPGAVRFTMTLPLETTSCLES